MAVYQLYNILNVIIQICLLQTINFKTELQTINFVIEKIHQVFNMHDSSRGIGNIQKIRSRT